MKIPVLVLFAVLAGMPAARAEYAQELRDQIAGLLERHAQKTDMTYFHDMGIIARKADESGETKLLVEILRTHLFARMEEYVRAEVAEINRMYEDNEPGASRRLAELNRYQSFYEPSEDFLGTAKGQTLTAEIVRLRDNAAASLEKDCGDFSTREGLVMLRKSGLFVTRRGPEIAAVRRLEQALDCCLSWKPKVTYKHEQPFKSEYEQGVVTEEATLALQTNRRDYDRAVWSGEWVTRFQGREGTGQGLTQAKLVYGKDGETADLTMPASRVSSVGRMNFPVNLSGSKRTLEIAGTRLHPQAVISGQALALAGCREETAS